MNRKNLLYAAAFLTLLTCLGHSIGTLVPREPQSEALRLAQTMMETTMVPFPVGTERPLAHVVYGGNVIISLYLLVAGLLFFLSAKPERFVKSIVTLNCWGLVACAIFSSVFFFPLPAIWTGIAAGLGFASLRDTNSGRVTIP